MKANYFITPLTREFIKVLNYAEDVFVNNAISYFLANDSDQYCFNKKQITSLPICYAQSEISDNNFIGLTNYCKQYHISKERVITSAIEIFATLDKDFGEFLETPEYGCLIQNVFDKHGISRLGDSCLVLKTRLIDLIDVITATHIKPFKPYIESGYDYIQNNMLSLLGLAVSMGLSGTGWLFDFNSTLYKATKQDSIYTGTLIFKRDLEGYKFRYLSAINYAPEHIKHNNVFLPDGIMHFRRAYRGLIKDSILRWTSEQFLIEYLLGSDDFRWDFLTNYLKFTSDESAPYISVIESDKTGYLNNLTDKILKSSKNGNQICQAIVSTYKSILTSVQIKNKFNKDLQKMEV